VKDMAAQLGIVVGIDSDGVNLAYRVLVATIAPKQGEEKQFNWKFDCKLMSEAQVIQLLQRKVKWLNIKLENNKIKGSSGDLKRFESKGSRPYVIISQLVNSDGKLIGYKVADYNGGVKNIRIKEVIAYGARATKQGCIPVQNAIFVPATKDSDGTVKSAHYKSYPGCNFIEERIVVNRNTDADTRRVSTNKNEKTLNKLEEIYTKEQIEQLKIGKKNGVDIRIYANPALSAEQMAALRNGLQQKVNVRPFAFPEYTVECMKYYTMEAKYGMDIRKYLSPKYSIAQIAELSIAVNEGLDVSKMSDPSLSVRKMQERRIRLENGVFHEIDVNMDGSWI
jgi:hypothetical protein